MTLEEFGATLRAEREKKGLSLDDVSNALKIPARTIRVLEEGDRENFPHIAYAKGFLRSYGNYLGIPQEEMLQTTSLFSHDPSLDTPLSRESAGDGRSVSGLLPQLLVTALILGILGGAGYLIWQRGFIQDVVTWVTTKAESFRKTTAQDKQDSVSANQAKDQTAEKKASASRDQSRSREQEQKAAPLSVQASQESQPQTTAITLPAPQSSSQETPAPQDSSSVVVSQANGGLQQVIIVATESCWIHSTADKTDTRQFSLRKGDTFALPFREELELKLGNAGGVRFRYNGKDLEPVGKPGQVKTVRFPQMDIQ